LSAASFLRKLIGGGSRDDRRVEQLVAQCSALLAESGEYASSAIAGEALAAYRSLDDAAREEFFDILSREYSPPPEVVSRAAAAYQQDPSPEHLEALQDVVEPQRQELFRRLNTASGGTAGCASIPNGGPSTPT